MAEVSPIYICKNNSGLELYEGIRTWYKDPENIFERLFFKQHYPCGSFVVISKKGKFISYFGEYPYTYIFEAAKKLIK